ncbi:DNA-protecting protein DprA, partial [Clostridium saudiense]|nr:DNA-protecting protein DprA [Clostridium saudiense]
NKEGISSYNLSNDELKKIIERISKLKEYQLKNEIKSVSILDDRYPILLKQINNAPIVLHYKGNLSCLINEKIVSVVGTRYPTDNGIRVAYKTAKYFAEKNYSVVSGLALGCDTYAHRATVEINKSTIAVMPCGLDTIIPKINSKLADKILSTNGCIISEYICGSVVSKYNYVNRNRIQSGLSKAILVVETGEKGGTIETIKHGLNQKKIIGCYDSDEYY